MNNLSSHAKVLPHGYVLFCMGYVSMQVIAIFTMWSAGLAKGVMRPEEVTALRAGLLPLRVFPTTAGKWAPGEVRGDGDDWVLQGYGRWRQGSRLRHVCCTATSRPQPPVACCFFALKLGVLLVCGFVCACDVAERWAGEKGEAVVLHFRSCALVCACIVPQRIMLCCTCPHTYRWGYSLMMTPSCLASSHPPAPAAPAPLPLHLHLLVPNSHPSNSHPSNRSTSSRSPRQWTPASWTAAARTTLPTPSCRSSGPWACHCCQHPSRGELAGVVGGVGELTRAFVPRSS